MAMQYLLLYKFLTLNIVAFVFAGLGYYLGYLDYVIQADKYYITAGITAFFLLVWSSTLFHVYKTTRRINALRKGTIFRLNLTSKDEEHNRSEVKWLKDASSQLAGFGLVGTVIGYILIFSNMGSQPMNDITGVQAAIQFIVEGTGVALTTTLAGAVLGIWNEMNQRLLSSGINYFWTETLRSSESGDDA